MDTFDNWKNDIVRYMVSCIPLKSNVESSVASLIWNHGCKASDLCLENLHNTFILPHATAMQQFTEDLIRLSNISEFKILAAEWKNNKLYISFDHCSIMQHVIHYWHCMDDNHTVHNLPCKSKIQQITILSEFNTEQGDIHLSSSRVSEVAGVCSKLLTYHGYHVNQSDSVPVKNHLNEICIHISDKLCPYKRHNSSESSINGSGDESCQMRAELPILIGPVLNHSSKKKELTVTKQEYLAKLIAGLMALQHQHGRCPEPPEVKQLAEAVFRHQLFSVSAVSPCQMLLDQPNIISSNNQLLFIMYNYTRIQAVLRRFEEMVNKGVYPPLPNISEMNCFTDTLITEDEWHLIWNHLLVFTSLLQQCVDRLLLGHSTIHRICRFLTEMSGSFSRFYSRVHILVNAQSHLMQAVHARVHLLKAVSTVYEIAFRILGYVPPSVM